MVAKTSTVRRRVCRVAASVTIAGEQDIAVRIADGFEGKRSIAVRIGTLLVYVEDTKALTSLVEAAVTASKAGDKVFGNEREADARRAGAWRAMHRRNRHYA